VDPLVAFLVSWFALVGIVYAVNKNAVRYFVAIYWKTERLNRRIEEFVKRLSFVPLRAYLAAALVLALAPIFIAMPFVRPDGQVQALPGFLYMLIGGTATAVQTLLSGAPVAEAASRSAGVTPIIPGVTLPWGQLPYLAVAIAVGVALHEFMHAYAALRYGIPLRHVGVFSLFYIISGAFVEPDEEAYKKSSVEAKAAVLASGVAANVALALLAMLAGVAGAWAGLYGAVFGVSAFGVDAGDRVLEIRGCGLAERVYTPDDFITKINVLAGMGPLMGINRTAACKPGDEVTLVVGKWWGTYEVKLDYSNFTTPPRINWLFEDGSLYRVGVRPGDVVKAVEGCGVSEEIRWGGQLLSTLLSLKKLCRPGDVIRVAVERNGTTVALNVTLVGKGGEVYYGLGPGSLPMLGYDAGPIKASEIYNTEFTKLVFWFLVVNYGLAVVNALPIYPLDGGQLVAALAQKRLGERRGQQLVNALSVVLAAMLIFNLALGVLGGQYKVLQMIR